MGKHTDQVREKYFNDPFISDQDYGLLMEAADAEDQQDALAAEQDTEEEEEPRSVCEDYPCCGHEWGDCNGQKYGSDEAIKQAVYDRMHDGDDDHPAWGEE